MFTKIDGAEALLKRAGGFRLGGVYELEHVLYVKSGAEYVRLYSDGSTSKDKVSVERLTFPDPLHRNPVGWLVTGEHPDAGPIRSNDRIIFRRTP